MGLNLESFCLFELQTKITLASEYSEGINWASCKHILLYFTEQTIRAGIGAQLAGRSLSIPEVLRFESSC